MPQIQHITARQILDSRGHPTVEATVTLSDGITATSSVPSGNIANELEAHELRDQVTSEYFGLGVSKAVNNVNTLIAERLVGMDPLYQTQVDQALVDLDGTTNKSKLGGNAMLAVSQAVMKSAAESLKLPLFIYVKEKYQLIQAYRIPTPIFNLINGGRHGSGTLDFQEFQIVPASHLGYNDALRIGVEMFMALDKVLEQKGAIRTVGLEGGFSPNLAHNADALEIFNEAAKLTNYTLTQEVFLGVDITPKSFYKSGKFTISDKAQPMNMKEFMQYLHDLHQQYRVFSFEDPLPPDAWKDWQALTADLGETSMILGDDLITTNKTLLMKAIQEKSCNALVIKPNRVGTVTETIEIANIAKQAKWHTVMSHRSGETTDDFWADIAVGIGTDYVKFGAPSRGERVVKYNRLLRIEEILLRSKESNQSSNNGDSSMNLPSTNAAGAAPAANPMPATPATMPSTPTPTAVPSMSEPTTVPAMPTGTPAPAVEPVNPAPSMPAADATLSPTPMGEAATAAQPASVGNPMPVTPESTSPTSSTVPPTATPALSSTPSLASNDLSDAASTGGLTLNPVAPTESPESGGAVLPQNGLMGNPSYVATGTPTTSEAPSMSPAVEVPPTAAPAAAVEATDIQSSLNELVQMAGTSTPAPETTITPAAAPVSAVAGGLRPPTPPTLSAVPSEV